MADFTVTAADVRPLIPSNIIQKSLGGSANVGDLVYIASDGDVEVTDANAAITVEVYGMIVGIEGGRSSGVAGQVASIALPGSRIAGFSSLTPGALGYVSPTAAKIANPAPTGAGSWTKVAGRCESATVFYFDPDIEAAASNS